ncbi:MAG: glutamate-cysteine ligase family protein [Nocardioidaceae bacterium]
MTSSRSHDVGPVADRTVPTEPAASDTPSDPHQLLKLNPLPPTWPWDAPETPVRDHDEASGYVAMVCFKHGPPIRHGLELEWTVHHPSRPSTPLELHQLRAALGIHAPTSLDPTSPWLPLPRGSRITVEPGGQVEISTPPSDALPELLDTTRSDAASLRDLLSAGDLTLGTAGVDPHRPPTRILSTPRYDAMQAFFDRIGPAGAQMMCSTASTQLCIDTGELADLPLRWRALHQLGPSLVALFANSPRINGHATGWASSRLPRVFATAPPTSSPPANDADPRAAYTRMCLEAPVLCIRRDEGGWDAPAGLTLADWVADPRVWDLVGRRPTYIDIDYHLTTIFPPVRAHGYLEVRYLDAQPAEEWVAPAALLACLMADHDAVEQALDATAEVAHAWLTAAREGLDNAALARAATRVVEVGLKTVEAAGLGTPLTNEISHIVQGRLARPRPHSRRTR